MEPAQLVVAGLVLGLSGGITPGPTTTLVVAETLRDDLAAGAKVAFAPLLTDGPIIALSLLVLDGLSSIDGMIGAIRLAGAAVLAYLGITTFRGATRAVERSTAARSPVWRGLLANAINPHPYVFWTLVGGPLLLEAWQRSAVEASGFLAAFYAAMIGSKVALAWIVDRGRTFVAGRAYRVTARVLGLVLLGFGVVFSVQGIAALGG